MKGQINSTLNDRNKQDLEDKDGDHIPDRIDGTYSSEGHITQSDVQTTNYWRAIVTAEEYDELMKNSFPCDRAKINTEDGKLPIRFKSELKHEFQKIISSSATIKVGGKNGK